MDDERWGQRVTALVQPRPGEEPTLEELVEFTRGRLAGYKAPRELHLIDEMPRQPSGKPDYKTVRSLIQARDNNQPSES
ncbi:MAG: hypothetical protein KDB13_15850, partial [Microthrixaceae bacterium]|nr:hypothetical protein [Microthrixaceae bacterium]